MTFRHSLYTVTTLLILSACGGKTNDTTAPANESAATSQTSSTQSPVDMATAANVMGTVKFSGTAPKAAKISMNADAYCKTTHSTDAYAEDVIVNPNKTLKNVYVYVKSGLSADLKFPVPTEAVILDQKGCVYDPHVVAIQVGQTLTVMNSDGVLHNVNVRPKNNQGFNQGQPVQGMKFDKTFSSPEVMIPTKCDVHPWMNSYIGVQNHPFASVTGTDGSFSLKDLPPGTYEIEAWHEKYGVSSQKVTVGAKENKTIEFTFKGA
jgi:plastocyanin